MSNLTSRRLSSDLSDFEWSGVGWVPGSLGGGVSVSVSQLGISSGQLVLMFQRFGTIDYLYW